MTFDAVLYTVYVASMAAGALLFVSWSRDPKGLPQWEYIVAAFIPVWSGLAYLAMGFGLGMAEVDGRTVYWARYADWVVTTPLLLAALWMTATTGVRKSKRAPTLVTLVAADIVMILCGLVADLSESDAARFTFYAIGVAALGVVFSTVWGPLRRIAGDGGPEIGRIYTTAATYLTIFWIGYPLTWILGPSGLGLVPQSVDTALFVLLPILSKVGYGALNLSLLRAHLGRRGSSQRTRRSPPVPAV